MKKLLTFFALLLLAPAAWAQFTLDAELRPRTELRHGYKTLSYPGTDPAFFVSQRTRLKAGYVDEKFKFYLSLQDVRTWGSTSQLNISDNFFSVHEAWGSYNITKTFSMKMGRQEIIYDDHRIFGSVDWAQQGRSHDALLFLFRTENKWKIDVGAAFNQNKENLFTTTYTVENSYKTIQYLWLHKDINDFGFSVLILNNGIQYFDVEAEEGKDYSTVFSQTMGTRLTYKFDIVDLAGAFYYQMGKDNKNRDLSAPYFALNAIFKVVESFKIDLGVESLSGTDDDRTDGKNTSFTPLYGTNHKFNGHMDYFYVGNWGNDVGLNDLYLRFLYGKGKWSAFLAAHYFASAATIIDPKNPGNSMSSYLGTELDLAFSFQMVPAVSLKAGYSQMFASSSMEVKTGGSKDTYNGWAWAMLVFKPKLVK